MRCYVCGERGRAIGMWKSPVRRAAFVRMRCERAACRFEYRNLDGAVVKGRPVWMAPAREVWG